MSNTLLSRVDNWFGHKETTNLGQYFAFLQRQKKEKNRKTIYSLKQ